MSLKIKLNQPNLIPMSVYKSHIYVKDYLDLDFKLALYRYKISESSTIGFDLIKKFVIKLTIKLTIITVKTPTILSHI